MRDAVIHGGNVWEIAEQYGIPVESLIDFSANINPRGLPPGAMERLQRDTGNPNLITRYPDPSYAALRRALAERAGISPDAILIGEGAAALIGATLRAIKPARCLLPIPAFGEYARACASAETKVEPFQLDSSNGFVLTVHSYAEQVSSTSCDCAILNNPHNPTGALMRKQALIDLIERIRVAGAFVLLDEAFIDYVPEETVVSYASRTPGVVVIRSLTKFFGCPALRVGYAVGLPETLRQITRAVPTWPVTIFAANALEAALQDRTYTAQSLRENEEERDCLARSLKELGAHVTSSSANFLLIQLQEQWPDSTFTREHLIRRHRIVVRNCDSFIGLEKGRYIRIAVRSKRDNGLLLSGLRELWN
jgi:threonine-phosphate decarboxylase